MESVKNLMVRKHTNPQRMVHKPFMQRTVYRFKGNVIASFLKKYLSDVPSASCCPSRYTDDISVAGNR